MRGKSWIQWGVGLASVGLCVAMAQATVSVNICDGASTSRDQRMGATDVAGAIDRVGNWNNFAEVDLVWSDLRGGETLGLRDDLLGLDEHGALLADEDGYHTQLRR